MQSMGRNLAFVLASSNHGTMIVNRFDYRMNEPNSRAGSGSMSETSARGGSGVGQLLLETAAAIAGEAVHHPSSVTSRLPDAPPGREDSSRLLLLFPRFGGSPGRWGAGFRLRENGHARHSELLLEWADLH